METILNLDLEYTINKIASTIMLGEETNYGKEALKIDLALTFYRKGKYRIGRDDSLRTCWQEFIFWHDSMPSERLAKKFAKKLVFYNETEDDRVGDSFYHIINESYLEGDAIKKQLEETKKRLINKHGNQIFFVEIQIRKIEKFKFTFDNFQHGFQGKVGTKYELVSRAHSMLLIAG